MRRYNDKAENYRKAVTFQSPDYIPVNFVINDACWHHYDQEMLLDLIESHPLLFPDFQRPNQKFIPRYASVARADQPYTDDFGCLWKTSDDGITGTVVGHPLADWSAFDSYSFPDPEHCMGLGSINWDQERQRIEQLKASGEFVKANLRHGHTFCSFVICADMKIFCLIWLMKSPA